VIALGSGTDPLRHSRCAEFVDGAGDLQTSWLEYLHNATTGSVLLPCSDDGLELIGRNVSTIRELGLVPVEARGEVLLALLDKHRCYTLALDAGIPVPETVAVTDAGDLRRAAARVGFPCALKPRYSHVFHRHVQGKGFVAGDQAELERAFARTTAIGIDMLVTELIPGRDDVYPSCFSYLDENGEPLLLLTKHKLRQYPIGFGTASYHVTNWDPEAAELGVRFLRAVGMRGLANVEFKRDPRDGRLKLIECNPRLTGTTGLFRAAGVDLPLFIYSRLAGRQTPAVGTYRLGMGMWWPLNDFRAFQAYRRRGELSFRGWSRSLLRPQHLPLASWRDPMPTIVALSRRVTNGLKKLQRG
jgi:predicted ATP-grasp superfamily ATP-dependent carboligase